MKYLPEDERIVVCRVGGDVFGVAGDGDGNNRLTVVCRIALKVPLGRFVLVHDEATVVATAYDALRLLAVFT